jgi:hypothetical protein
VAGETLTPALLIAAAVVDPWCLQFHGSGSQGDFSGGSPPVTHHQSVTLFVAGAAMAFDVTIGFPLKCRHQHAPRSLARDLVQHQKLLARFPCILVLDYPQHRWRPPSTRLPPGGA